MRKMGALHFVAAFTVQAGALFRDSTNTMEIQKFMDSLYCFRLTSTLLQIVVSVSQVFF